MPSPSSSTSSLGCPHSSASPSRVQCDNGREFDNSTSRAFFLSHSVQVRMSCPYTSSPSGKAERMIRTTNDTMRTLLLQASLPARFWAESLHTSTYLLNAFLPLPAQLPRHTTLSSIRSPLSLWVCVLPEHHHHRSPQVGSPFDSLCLPRILPGSHEVSMLRPYLSSGPHLSPCGVC